MPQAVLGSQNVLHEMLGLLFRWRNKGLKRLICISEVTESVNCRDKNIITAQCPSGELSFLRVTWGMKFIDENQSIIKGKVGAWELIIHLYSGLVSNCLMLTMDLEPY